MRDRDQKLFLYRVEGIKPNGKRKAHIKCSKQQADAMAHSWRKGRPDVVTHTGEKIDLEPLKDVKVTRSVHVVWPDEVPRLKHDLLMRLADHLEDTLDWDERQSDPDYLLGYRDVIGKIVGLAEDYRKEADGEPSTDQE